MASRGRVAPEALENSDRLLPAQSAATREALLMATETHGQHSPVLLLDVKASLGSSAPRVSADPLAVARCSSLWEHVSEAKSGSLKSCCVAFWALPRPSAITGHHLECQTPSSTCPTGGPAPSR